MSISYFNIPPVHFYLLEGRQLHIFKIKIQEQTKVSKDRNCLKQALKEVPEISLIWKYFSSSTKDRRYWYW